MSRKPPSIYDYNDYRVFLRDYFAWKKANDPGFTQRGFAALAGFGAHSFCNYLIKGRRNLTSASCEQLCRALGFDDKEVAFFSLLVEYNQSVATDERDRLFHRLNTLRRNTTFYRLNKKHYSYFDEWYYPVLREAVVLGDWDGDYALLGKMLDPPITSGQARRGVRVLQSIGLIGKNDDGTWSQMSDAVVAADFPLHLITKARQTYIRMGLDASERLGPKSRNVSCATVALTEDAYKKVSEMLDAVHNYAISLSARKGDRGKIYQLNFQLFPLSKNVLPRGGNDNV